MLRLRLALAEGADRHGRVIGQLVVFYRVLRRGLLRLYIRAVPTRLGDGVDHVRLSGEHGSWFVFITQTKNLIVDLSTAIENIQSKLFKKESVEDVFAKVDSIRKEISNLESEPVKLTKLTQDFLINASEGAKQQRINLIDKTDKYAELQAKLASLNSEGSHLDGKMHDLKKENLRLRQDVFLTFYFPNFLSRLKPFGPFTTRNKKPPAKAIFFINAIICIWSEKSL